MAKNVDGTGHVQAHIDEGGGAIQVTERDVTKDDEGNIVFPIQVDNSGGTVHVQTLVIGGGGTVQDQTVGGRDGAKDDEHGGGVHDRVLYEHVQVDDEAELAKEVGHGPAVCSRKRF